MKNLSLQDVVDFVITYRRNKVFKGFSEAQIAGAVNASIAAGAFAYAQDERTGRLTGICVASPSPSEKKLHVKHILTIAPGVVPKLLEIYHTFFNGWTITARRRGRYIEYSTPRLVSLLEANA